MDFRITEISNFERRIPKIIRAEMGIEITVDSTVSSLLLNKSSVWSGKEI